MRLIRDWLLLCLFLFILGLPIQVKADIQTPESLQDLEWEYQYEVSYIGKGWIQSSCVTDKYIVCFQNKSGKKKGADTLIAFYKSDQDEEGNPVPKYSYAMHVTEMDYEHGNGMTYNPNTNEIYITPGPLENQESSGNIYVVDADTLMYKRTIKMGDGSINYNFIAYSEDTNQYILQTDDTGGEIFHITDENFNVVDTMEDLPKLGERYFQDFCISGDYILSISHSSENRAENYIEVYSISQRAYLGNYYINLDGGERVQEVESISEISPGVLAVFTGVTDPRRLRFYEATVPAVFDVETQVVNGSITESTNQAPGGENYTVKFKPDKHYELTELLVDGEPVACKPNQKKYTFKNLNEDHTIEAIFGKIPKYQITTVVENGRITDSKKVYRDKNFKVSYTPDTHYELSSVLIDGQEVELEGIENGYEFQNIQSAHTIEVRFEEIPSWEITTRVSHGSITDSIQKAYRDTTQTISYEPEENYMLFSIKVDGEKVDTKTYASEYTFSSIYGPHTIEVTYIWKYLPVCLLALLIGLLALLLGVRLHVKRKKIKKKWRNR